MAYSPNNYQTYYQPPKQTVPNMNFQGLKGRPVSSIEEVRATPVDFDGSVFFFPDLANKCIYTKQIGMDGTAVLNMYELKEIPIAQQFPTGDFITRKEFEEALLNLKQSLQAPSQAKETIQF